MEAFHSPGGSLSTWPATHPRPEKASKRVPFQAFRRRRRLLEKEYPFHRRSSQSTLRVSFHYLCRRLEMLFWVCWIRHLEVFSEVVGHARVAGRVESDPPGFILFYLNNFMQMRSIYANKVEEYNEQL